MLFELRIVLRGLWRRPWVLAAAVVPLGLALGANATLFGVLDAVVLRPRALLQSDSLYVLWETSAMRNALMSEISYPDFLDWRRESETFSDMAAMGSINWAHGWSESDGSLRQIPYRSVSWSFFDVVGVDAAMGRTFVPEDDSRDAARVVVVSHGFWQSSLGGEADVIGKRLLLGPNGDEPYTVIGVMPREFGFPRDAEMWAPLGRDLAYFGQQAGFDAVSSRGLGVLFALGRLSPSVTAPEAETELTGIVRNLSRTVRERAHWDQWQASLVPVEIFELGNVPKGLWVLTGAAAGLLLMGASSVGGLLLARSMARRQEFSVCEAIGAGRHVVSKRIALEAIVLVSAAVPIGWVAAQFATPALVDRLNVGATVEWARGSVLGLLAFAATTVWVAALPILAVRVSQRFDGPTSLSRWQRPFVVVETATAMVLLIAAVLLTRSYLELQKVDLGFRPQSVLSFQTGPLDPASREATQAFFRDLLTRVASLEGVVAAAAVRNRPLLHGAVGDDWTFIHEGQSLEDRDTNPTVNSMVVTPGYFHVMGSELLAGRDFARGDHEEAPLVTVISESLARYAFPGEDPLGKRLSVRSEDGEPLWHTVIGVVADARYRSLTATRLDFYHADAQAGPQPTGLVVRTRGDPYALVPAVRRLVNAIDPKLDIERVTSMQDAVATSMAPWRFHMWVAGLFAAFALGVCGLGLFGIVAYAASQRTQEMGIRAAIGATPADIWRHLTAESLGLVVVGIVVGTALGLTFAKLVSSLLYGIRATDAVSFIVSAGVLLALGVFACHVAARNAALVSPLTALRHE